MSADPLTQSAHTLSSVPASRYTFEQLADIYNRARVDYIVPMPMNAKRMEEYVRHYDIDLDASHVSLNSDGCETGVIMLGIRKERAWITRLGVIPERRGHGTGGYLMNVAIEAARARGCRMIQLEVIIGNEPARRLFVKLGFQPTRTLAIVRRPPGKLDPALAPELVFGESWGSSMGTSQIVVSSIPETEIPALLARRPSSINCMALCDSPAWTEETPSLLHAGGLRGLHVSLPSGESGWIVFQRTAFQLTHFVFRVGISAEMAYTLLYTLHSQNAVQDTKIENLPIDSPLWEAYQRIGYVEAFRRLEMFLPL
jgi:GNAT superfamily N-acetyltransferase